MDDALQSTGVSTALRLMFPGQTVSIVSLAEMKWLLKMNECTVERSIEWFNCCWLLQRTVIGSHMGTNQETFFF